MMGTSRLGRRENIPGISEINCLEKFCYFLSTILNAQEVIDKGPTVASHLRINLKDRINIDVIIYQNDTLFISSSPKTPENIFHETCSKILEIAKESVIKLEDTRPVTLLRAQSILKFISGLDLDDDHRRMVIVILSDTINEIILTERMKTVRIRGPPLKMGIPAKIEYLEKKGRLVYLKTEIINTRELRNGIVHQGNIPSRDQAEKALELAGEVLKKA